MDNPEREFGLNSPALVSRPAPRFINKVGRGVWWLTYFAFFRMSPIPMHGWRVFLLRIFGAKIGSGVRIYPSVRIWAPWNLIVGNAVTVGPRATLYTVDFIELHDNVIVSQGAHLCSATHDICAEDFALLCAPIIVHENAWIAAEAFVCPGIEIGQSAVIGARSTITKNVAPYSVMASNAARVIGTRPVNARNHLGNR